MGNVRHEYETEGGKVYRELIYNGNTLTFDLRYFYDAAGRPAMLQLLTATDSGSMESTVFYYGTNAQGDVIAIYDANGNKIVSYTYDAWGNTLSTQTNGTWGSTVSSLNPFGYRSYYYDSDTGLYYPRAAITIHRSEDLSMRIVLWLALMEAWAIISLHIALTTL